jgi:hypothetical protein
MLLRQFLLCCFSLFAYSVFLSFFLLFFLRKTAVFNVAHSHCLSCSADSFLVFCVKKESDNDDEKEKKQKSRQRQRHRGDEEEEEEEEEGENEPEANRKKNKDAQNSRGAQQKRKIIFCTHSLVRSFIHLFSLPPPPSSPLSLY